MPDDKRARSRRKVSDYRARMRARGIRLLQLWVPDTRSPAFARQAHEQSRAVARSRAEAEDQAFVDAVTDRGET